MTLNRKIAPEFHQVEKINFLPVSHLTLKNGIPVDIIAGGSQDILKIDFVFKAGLYFQDKRLVASATNALLKEGSQNYSAYEIAEGIDSFGAFLEVGNSFDTAHVTLYTLSTYLTDVLPIVKDVIVSPSFDQKELDIYTKNAKEKLQVNQKKVSYIARKAFSALLFGEGAYSNPVSEVDYDHLERKDLVEFHATHYNLSNCSVLISGKVTDNTLAQLEDFFGKEQLTKTNISQDKSTLEMPITQRHIEKEGALQSAIRIGRKMPNKCHADYFGLKVLNTILGGYFGSRLMSNIREDKGYTYGIGSGLVSMLHSGYFFISTEVQGDATKDAINEIYKEIERLQKDLVPKDELELVQNYMLGQLLNSCDGPFKMGALYGEINSYELSLDYYNSYIDSIKKITPEELKALGVKYLNRKDLCEVVVGKI